MKVKKIYETDKLEFFVPDTSTKLDLPFVNASVTAGFPSPADDYAEESLDLNRKLITNPSSTFFVRVNGDSMSGDGIYNGDLLVVDKSLFPGDKSILVCFIDGEFTLKRVEVKEDGYYLLPSNPEFKPIKINPESDFRLWGVVTYSIKKHF